MSYPNEIVPIRRAFDPYWFKKHAGPMFAKYLREQFGGNVALIAQTFQVREQTVLYWLSETTTPSGATMASAMVLYPDFAERIREEYQREAS